MIFFLIGLFSLIGTSDHLYSKPNKFTANRKDVCMVWSKGKGLHSMISWGKDILLAAWCYETSVEPRYMTTHYSQVHGAHRRMRAPKVFSITCWS